MKSLAHLLVIVTLCSVVQANVADTLSYHDRTGAFVYYRDPQIAMQAARFTPLSSAWVQGVVITLGGNSRNGSARVHLFGHEGGGAAPVLRKDLVAPITIRKTRPGVERIVAMFPQPVFVTNDQVFVGIDSLDAEVTLLSDRKAKTPECFSHTGDFYYQFIGFKDGSWRWSVYAYAIDMIVEYPDQRPQPAFVDITTDVGVHDTLIENQSIAWGDIDNDNYLDLLLDGRLYRNQGGKSFVERTWDAGIAGRPRANMFIDVNNDAEIDILFLGSYDTLSRESELFVNQGNGTFRRRKLDIPIIEEPTNFSMADANGDGYLDLFVGQRGLEKGTKNYLLINDRHLGFYDASAWIGHDELTTRGCLSSQWIDYDGDGPLELFVIFENGAAELWKQTGDSTFLNIADRVLSATMLRQKFATGCDWADYDNDGDVDLLLASAVGSMQPQAELQRTMIFANTDPPVLDAPLSSPDMGIEYEEKHSSGAWADVNNDGLLDLVTATSYPCRYLDLYIQNSNHRFDLKTDDYGLRKIAASRDAVWADYDNDGRLDLATFSDGQFHLFRNMNTTGGRYIEVEIAGGMSQAVGGGVTVYAGKKRYTRQVTAGRGILMEGPARLHFGIDQASMVDSIVVQSRDGKREVYGPFASNSLYILGADHGLASGTGTEVLLEAHPNPFTTTLTLQYSISRAQRVRLDIHSLEGDLIETLVDEMRSTGTHTVAWDAKDRQGRRLPQGTYIYRLKTDAKEITGRALLVE